MLENVILDLDGSFLSLYELPILFFFPPFKFIQDGYFQRFWYKKCMQSIYFWNNNDSEASELLILWI